MWRIVGRSFPTPLRTFHIPHVPYTHPDYACHKRQKKNAHVFGKHVYWSGMLVYSAAYFEPRIHFRASDEIS